MSNVGTLTGLAGLEAVKRAGPGKAAIFCLGGLPTGAPSVIEKTTNVGRIVGGRLLAELRAQDRRASRLPS